MNYIQHYNNLIVKHGHKEKPEGYYELHHIIPRSHGGSDDSSNLIYLSARCHYLAHWLLLKIHQDVYMTHAFHMMSNSKRYNSKGFELARKKKSELMKKCNPMFDRNNAKKQGQALIKEDKVIRPKGENQSMNRSESLKGNQHNAKLTYLVIHPDGTEEVVKSMRAFCRLHNLNQTCMTRVCKGRLENHFGFKAKYLTTANE